MPTRLHTLAVVATLAPARWSEPVGAVDAAGVPGWFTVFEGSRERSS